MPDWGLVERGERRGPYPGRRAHAHPDQPGQGPLPAGGIHQGRGDRLLPADRAGDAAARGRPGADPAPLPRRRRARPVLLLREERPDGHTAVGPPGHRGHQRRADRLRGRRRRRDAGLAGQPGRAGAPRAAVDSAQRHPARGCAGPPRHRAAGRRAAGRPGRGRPRSGGGHVDRRHRPGRADRGRPARRGRTRPGGPDLRKQGHPGVRRGRTVPEQGRLGLREAAERHPGQGVPGLLRRRHVGRAADAAGSTSTTTRTLPPATPSRRTRCAAATCRRWRLRSPGTRSAPYAGPTICASPPPRCWAASTEHGDLAADLLGPDRPELPH